MKNITENARNNREILAECRPRHEKKKMKNITENRVWGGREERQANLKREATAATRYIVLSVRTEFGVDVRRGRRI
ncbi:hypothetical protein QE152_g1785 [Popillia japonica]|uniref:Uncharacterized protein n=1 Tax=Popillia japonica TaxID=7064 RepID=A0AAW1N5A6_POPJA